MFNILIYNLKLQMADADIKSTQLTVANNALEELVKEGKLAPDT